VPGRVDAPGSWGPHQLIKDGAKLVERIEDVLEALGRIGEMLEDYAGERAGRAEAAQERSLFPGDDIPIKGDEAAVMTCLKEDVVHIDEIIHHSGLGAGQVHAAMTSLQLKGLVKPLPGSYYRKRQS